MFLYLNFVFQISFELTEEDNPPMTVTMNINNNNNKGEDVLLQLSDVHFQKLSGTLFVLSSRVAWAQQGQDDFAVSVYFADVDRLKISPSHKPKKQLQIVLHNTEAFTFHFAGLNAESDRDSVKEMIQQILPKFERKMNSELQDKIKVLQQNPQLFKLYQELVPTGIMSAQEFWAVRKETTLNGQNSQVAGVSSSFLSDIQPSHTSSDKSSVHYNLQPDTIQSIFRIYPSVHQKYKSTVSTGEMTEQQFWAAFFQSHYIHRERIGLGTKELFADCAANDEKDEEKMRKAFRGEGGDSLLDIAKMDDGDSGAGFLTSTDNTSTSDAKTKTTDLSSSKVFTTGGSGSQTVRALIKRTNQHNVRLLQHSVGSGGKRSAQGDDKASGSSETKEVVESKRSRIEEICRLDDLTTPSAPDIAKVSLDGPNKFSQATINDSFRGFLPKSEKESFQALNIFNNQFSRWSPNPDAMGDAVCRTSFHPVSDFSILLPTSESKSSSSSNGIRTSVNNSVAVDQTNSSEKVSAKLKTEMQSVYLALNELLRNFWSCFPLNSPEKEEKMHRAFESVQKFESSILVKFLELCDDENQPDCATRVKHMITLVQTKFASASKVRKK